MGYTLILVQELNLAYKYSHLHWKVACLCVSAGDINDEITKATDYGAIATAIGGMEKGFVTPPYINTTGVGFTADVETQTCVFGLGAVKGISYDLAREIIRLRPYNSLADFIEKCVATKLVQPSKMYNLIKAGCFDKITDSRVGAMVEFVNYQVPNKTKLTTANIPKLIELGCIDESFIHHINLFLFRKTVFSKENVSRMINKTQGYYIVPDLVVGFFERELSKYFFNAVEYDNLGRITLSSKEFDKLYKVFQEPFTKWLQSEVALEKFNYAQKNVEWRKNCLGNISKWEMDSISYYYSANHELDEIGLDKFYTVEDFNELSKEPTYYYITNRNTNRERRMIKLSLIAGTVVDKNKNKSMITLNTQYGIVQVKLNRQSFARFDRKTDEEKSWFSRGNMLILCGYRRGETFYPRVHEDCNFRSEIMKIECDNGNIFIRKERLNEEEF